MTTAEFGQRWAAPRCRSEQELSLLANDSIGPASRDRKSSAVLLAQGILHTKDKDTKGSMTAQATAGVEWSTSGMVRGSAVSKPAVLQRSSNAISRRRSLSDELKNLWNRRPSLNLFRTASQVGHDSRMETHSEAQGGGTIEERRASDCDSENMTPSFFIVDRSLMRRPMKSERLFLLFGK